MPERVPAAFLRVLADLTGWLDSADVPAMVVGGVAVSIPGRPRATRDTDSLAILSEDRWSAVLADARNHGIIARIEQPLDFARRTRVLLLRHADSGIDIDVILGRLPYEEEAIARGEFHDLAGVRVKLPQVEDLMIMKAVAQRPRRHDARGVRAAGLHGPPRRARAAAAGAPDVLPRGVRTAQPIAIPDHAGRAGQRALL